MQNIHGAQGVSEMYMIIRVSRLNSERPRLRVYLDPERLRQEGLLYLQDIPGQLCLEQAFCLSRCNLWLKLVVEYKSQICFGLGAVNQL